RVRDGIERPAAHDGGATCTGARFSALAGGRAGDRRRIPASDASIRRGDPGRQSLLRLVAELFPSDARLVHQTAFRYGEDRHPVLVPAGRLGVVLSTARAGRTSSSSCLRRCARGDCDGGRLGAELEIAAGEVLKRFLVLKEYDFAVSLPAQLKPYGELSHRCVAHVGALHVHASRAVSAADSDSAFSYGGEHSVTVAVE